MKIFLSYARADGGDCADQIHVSSLAKSNDIFRDVTSIEGGDVWTKTIEDNISGCDLLVVILTPEALESNEVEKEVLLAKKTNRKILPCFFRYVNKDRIKWQLEMFEGIEFADKYELVRNLRLKLNPTKGLFEESSNKSASDKSRNEAPAMNEMSFSSLSRTVDKTVQSGHASTMPSNLANETEEDFNPEAIGSKDNLQTETIPIVSKSGEIKRTKNEKQVKDSLNRASPPVGHCVKCEMKQKIEKPRQIYLQNGTPAVQGTCNSCGSTMFKVNAITGIKSREPPSQTKKNLKSYVDKWNIKGVAFQDEDKFQEALEAFNRALEINEQNSEILTNKGNSLIWLKKEREAIKCFNKALEINPDNEDALSSKGICLHNLGRYGEALKFYDEALDMYPYDVEVLNNKGNSLTWLDRHEEALKCFNKVLRANRDNADALDGKGECLMSLGMYEEALKCFDRVGNRTRSLAALKLVSKHGKSKVDKNKLRVMKDKSVKSLTKTKSLKPDEIPEIIDVKDSRYLRLSALRTLKKNDKLRWYQKLVTLNKDDKKPIFMTWYCPKCKKERKICTNRAMKDAAKPDLIGECSVCGTLLKYRPNIDSKAKAVSPSFNSGLGRPPYGWQFGPEYPNKPVWMRNKRYYEQ